VRGTAEEQRRAQAFEVLYAAIREAGPALQSWEYEALIGLVGQLAGGEVEYHAQHPRQWRAT
jgi:hypothetical protein